MSRTINAMPVSNNNPDEDICTVFTGGFDWSQLKTVFTVYSTYKVEKTCDREEFKNLTMASIKAQLRGVQSSSITIRGGVHRNLMDVNLTPVQDQYYLIGNMQVSPIGQVSINLWEMLTGKKSRPETIITSSYTPFSIDSDMYYIWNIGTLAHQLVDPGGDKYIMMAYTNDVFPHLTRAGLTDLWSQLGLPSGWKYESVLLDKTVTIRSSSVMGTTSKVLFDDLSNYYIKYTR